MATFEELAELAKTLQPRNPCGKRVYSHGAAMDAARTRNRNRHNGEEWYVHPCYQGCGNSIFHLTTEKPRTKKQARINKGVEKTRYVHGKRARKVQRWEKNREMRRIIAFGTWEGEGGALDPREPED